METSGAGQASDELTSLPFASNTWTPAMSVWEPTFAFSISCHSRVANFALSVSGVIPAERTCAAMSLSTIAKSSRC